MKFIIIIILLSIKQKLYFILILSSLLIRLCHAVRITFIILWGDFNTYIFLEGNQFCKRVCVVWPFRLLTIDSGLRPRGTLHVSYFQKVYHHNVIYEAHGPNLYKIIIIYKLYYLVVREFSHKQNNEHDSNLNDSRYDY